MKTAFLKRVNWGRFGSNLVVLFLMVFLFPEILSAKSPAKNKLYDDLFSVSFPNERDGWTCGRWGSILHTGDGGKSWVRQKSGTELTLSSIYFVDPKNGWAVGDQGTIIHTADGGKTWAKQKSPVPFFLMKVYFVTPLKGWIVTEQTHILFTDDGGGRWSVQFKDQDFILKSLSFCDPLHGWAVGEYGYIYHTGDGGISWVKQAGHFELSENTGEIVGDPFLFDVVAVDSKTVWAVGIDGFVTKTVDGGKTWNNVEIGAPKTQLFCISTDRKNTLLIGGKGVFLSSGDKGHTWQSPRFDPSITYGWIYGLAKQGSSGFVAIGWEGSIYFQRSNAWHRINY